MMNVSLNELRHREMPVGARGGGWEVDLSLYMCVWFLSSERVCEVVFSVPPGPLLLPYSVEGYFLWVCRVTAVFSDVSFSCNQHHGQQHQSPQTQAPQQASISIHLKVAPSFLFFLLPTDLKELDR